VISLMQIPLPDNTQQSQGTFIHVLGGIRSSNPSKPKTHASTVWPLGMVADILSVKNNALHYVY
jgi:hypothetical protein